MTKIGNFLLLHNDRIAPIFLSEVELSRLASRSRVLSQSVVWQSTQCTKSVDGTPRQSIMRSANDSGD